MEGGLRVPVAGLFNGGRSEGASGWVVQCKYIGICVLAIQLNRDHVCIYKIGKRPHSTPQECVLAIQLPTCCILSC